MMDHSLFVPLPPEQFAVEAFFGALPLPYVARTLCAFASGHGAGFDEAFCTFPDDDATVPEKHVAFNIFDEEVLLTFEEFVARLGLYVRALLTQHPHMAAEVNPLFAQVENALLGRDSSTDG